MFFNIKKIASLAVISFVGLLSSLDVVLAATTEYGISVSQVEICKSSACSSPKILGSGAATFDIASASVGSAIGSYAATDDCPIGTIYTHIRVTMSRAITITGSVPNASIIGGVAGLGASHCATVTGADATGGAIGDVAVGTADAVTASQILWVPNINAFGGGIPSAAEFSAEGITLVDANNMQFLVALAAPITIGQTPPTIEVNFSTANSLGAFNNGGACGMFPLPPSVSLVIR